MIGLLLQATHLPGIRSEPLWPAFLPHNVNYDPAAVTLASCELPLPLYECASTDRVGGPVTGTRLINKPFQK